MGAKCPTCGQSIEGDKVFEGYMARLLMAALKCAKDQNVSWRVRYDKKRSEVVTRFLERAMLKTDFQRVGTHTQYARVSDLRFWGLLKREPEWFHQGIYQVTDLAMDFVTGHASIPKLLVVHKGNVLTQGQDLITFREALGDQWNDIPAWILDWRGESRQMSLI